jgi:hypothetical protein
MRTSDVEQEVMHKDKLRYSITRSVFMQLLRMQENRGGHMLHPRNGECQGNTDVHERRKESQSARDMRLRRMQVVGRQLA